jgi:hypothetical protein
MSVKGYAGEIHGKKGVFCKKGRIADKLKAE